jgi:hypothetical protein
MSKTRRPKNTRTKSGSTTVSIGGTSQSAFAGYATGKPAQPQAPQSKDDEATDTKKPKKKIKKKNN